MSPVMPALLLMFGLGAPAPAPKLRRDAPMIADFPDTSLQEILQKLGQTAGVKVLFDSSFRDKQASWKAEDETFDATLAKIFLLHKKAGRELYPNIIAVYDANPGRRRHYESWVPGGPLAAVRNRAPIRRVFTEESLQRVLEALGEHAGVRVHFDEAFRDKNVTIRFEDETFEMALDQLCLLNGKFYQPLDAGSIAVAEENPQMRRHYGGNYGPVEGQLMSPSEALGCGDDVPKALSQVSLVRFSDGLEVSLGPAWMDDSGKPDPSPLFYKHSDLVALPGGARAVDRIVGSDHGPAATAANHARRYVGYRMLLSKGREARSFRVEIQPLPEASWKRLCVSCAPEAQIRIERHPEPFEIGSGGSFAVDLMTNPLNDKRIVDQVTLVQPARAKDLPARRFKVDWTMTREVDHLVAGVCVRDLESGEALGGIPRVPVRTTSDTFVHAQEARSRSGKPAEVVVRIAVGEDRRTAVYSVELREAGEIVFSESTRLPLMLF